MGRLDTGSLVQWFGGTGRRRVGRLVCGQLEVWLVRRLVGWSVIHSFIHSDSQRAVRLVDCLFVWLSLAHGQSVAHPGWLVG